MEIEGKDKAQAGYDAIIWKLRAGYAAVFYTSLSFIVTVIDKKTFSLPPNSAIIIFSVLIVGFSIMIALLDYYFVKAKLRVVEAKDRLLDVAVDIATDSNPLSEVPAADLKCLLHNAGELDSPVDWSKFCARRPILLLYGGTCITGICAIILLFLSPIDSNNKSTGSPQTKAPFVSTAVAPPKTNPPSPK
jgi:hypothetical protein